MPHNRLVRLFSFADLVLCSKICKEGKLGEYNNLTLTEVSNDDGDLVVVMLMLILE